MKLFTSLIPEMMQQDSIQPGIYGTLKISHTFA